MLSSSTSASGLILLLIKFLSQNLSPMSLTPPRTPDMKASDSCSNLDSDMYKSNYLTVPGQQIAQGGSCFSLYDLDQVKQLLTVYFPSAFSSETFSLFTNRNPQWKNQLRKSISRSASMTQIKTRSNDSITRSMKWKVKTGAIAC